jgi:hypothetical protein
LIRRRHVFYVEGFDPQGAVGYYRMFERESRRFCRSWSVQAAVSELVIDSEDVAHWNVKTIGSTWQVETYYEFLRLERANAAQAGKLTSLVVADPASKPAQIAATVQMINTACMIKRWRANRHDARMMRIMVPLTASSSVQRNARYKTDTHYKCIPEIKYTAMPRRTRRAGARPR